MALRAAASPETVESWSELFKELDIKSELAQQYAEVLLENGYCGKTVKHMFSHSTPGIPSPTLVQLGIKPGHCLLLELYFRTDVSKVVQESDSVHKPEQRPSVKIKIPRPMLTLDINHTDFDQFKFEWSTYRSHYNIGDNEVSSQLFYCGDEDVRKRIRISQPTFTIPGRHTESELMNFLKDIVLSKISRIVHIKQFHDLRQKTGEPCNDFVSRLQTKASCCEFVCGSCEADTTPERVKEQFVVGLDNKSIQTAILKTESLQPGTSLERLLGEVLTLEQSIKDQASLKVPPGEMSCVDFEVDVNTDQVQAFSKSVKRSNVPPCSGCGRSTHQSSERQSRCPAWGKKCHSCGIMNHFKSCCRMKKTTRTFTQDRSTQFLDMTCLSVEVDKSLMITVTFQPLLKLSDKAHTVSVFPDTGANICLLGPNQLRLLGIRPQQIFSPASPISVAGGSQISATGKFHAKISLEGRETKQEIYFSPSADRFFLGRQACIELGIVPQSFPYPSLCSKQGNTHMSVQSSEVIRKVPTKPKQIPFQPIEENIPKLNQFLIEKFDNCVFNSGAPFPKLSTPPGKIHLKPDHIVPKPRYWPIPVAEHWSEDVRASIDKDVEAGVLKKVPFNEPTIWCAPMVIVRKKDGRPRRTVDYQQLNSQCLREPNYGEPPFHTARRVPLNSWKSTFDAVDGYHLVELDEASSKLTTFTTPWGRYRYLRFPQGHCGAGDAFNGRIQHIVSHIPRLVRIVDDICIYDETIQGAFWHAWELLSTCATNGIVMNKTKFKFCVKEVLFAGLSITPRGIQPSPQLLCAIEDYPPPTDLTKARAFFGLVNQVNWAYANSNEMSCFREMVRPNATYNWTDEMKALFEKCKEKIICQVREGVQNFSTDRVTCIQTDFCKEGLGYLLLQKYCDCSLESAPLCCSAGWKLVFAGSRFTKGAEARYAPTEGEALAVAWSLNHARMFTLGCSRLIVSTDHQPLLGIFSSKPLEKIANPRIVRLKEQTASFQFTVKYNKGKWHRAPDALSRNPQANIFLTELFSKGIIDESREDFVLGCEAEIAFSELESDGSLSLEDIRKSTEIDAELKALASAVENGFGRTLHLTPPIIRPYFNVRDDLWIQRGILMFKSRIVVPMALRKKILTVLHSAHQGVDGMRARASSAVYWPGLNANIRQMRANCNACNQMAPSQPHEPLLVMPVPQYPFQQVCIDAFQLDKHQYLAIVDKFSGWIIIFHVRVYPSSKHIIDALRSVFAVYGTPEILYTDGGLPFQSSQIKCFLRHWKVQHRTSSAFYPQSNGRAELAVKTAKRILRENTASDGSLNSAKACTALLQYRNTPIKHLGLSPAQLLFHRNLRDSLTLDPATLRPSKLWIEAAKQREEAFEQRNQAMVERYNRTSRNLSLLPVGTNVIIQDFNDKRWRKTGVVVEVRDRRYWIRMNGSGRVVTRNRRFLRPIRGVINDEPDPLLLSQLPSESLNKDSVTPESNPSEVVVPGSSLSPDAVSAQSQTRSNENVIVSESNVQQSVISESDTPESSVQLPLELARLPRMLRNLQPHNKPGLKE